MSLITVQTQPISSLPVGTPAGADLFLLLQSGIAKQSTIANLRLAIDIATEVDKGLMSAADKAILDTVATEVAAMLAPAQYTIASGATIIVPTGATFIILTGVTTITTVNGLTIGHPCYFYYPTGAGLVFLGNPVVAGDPPLIVVPTAS